MAGLQMTVVGVEKLLKKVDPDNTLKPAMVDLFRQGEQLAVAYLKPNIPHRTGASASRLQARTTVLSATVSLPAQPLRFVEFGTHNSGHRASLKAAGGRRPKAFSYAKGDNVHIAPRRFMATARNKTRAAMSKLIADLKDRIERAWSAA